MSHSIGTVDYFDHSFIQLMYFTGIYSVLTVGREGAKGNKVISLDLVIS